MPSVEFIEGEIGRSLTQEEISRVLERQSKREILNKLIDDREFDKARLMLNELKKEWGPLHQELVFAENWLDWESMEYTE